MAIFSREGDSSGSMPAVVFHMNSTEAWSMVLPIPDTIDGEKVEHSVDLGNAEKCLDYSPAEKELTLSESCDLKLNDKRIETVKIKLTTRSGLEELFNLLVLLQRFDHVEETKTWESPVAISDVFFDDSGKLVVQFNATMELLEFSDQDHSFAERVEPYTDLGERMIAGRPTRHNDSNCNVLNEGGRAPFLQVFLDHGRCAVCTDQSRLGFAYSAMDFAGDRLSVDIAFDDSNCFAYCKEKD